MSARISNHANVLRLSGPDRQFLLAGLAWIVSNYNEWQSSNKMPNARPDRSWLKPFDTGTYCQEFMAGVVALHGKVVALSRTGRLRLSASWQFAACSLAVRVAVRRHKHDHSKLNIPHVDSAHKRLLDRLEAARKCAKRAEIRESGAAAYAETGKEWRAFVQWLRVHFLDCRCSRKRRIPPLLWRKKIVVQFIQWARAELKDRREHIPADAELRSLVRLALRYVRRGRTRYSISALLNDRVEASAYFANFVTARTEKADIRRTRVEQNHNNG